MRKIALSSKVPSRIAVQRLRRGEIAAEGLLDDDARAAACSPTARAARRPCRTAPAEWRGSAPAAARRRAPCAAPGTSPGRCSRRRRSAAGRTSLSNAAASRPPCFSRLSLRARLELVEVPARLGDADDRHVRGGRASPSPAAPGRSSCTRGRRWRRRRPGRRNASSFMACSPSVHFAGFSRWPPNSKRIAESSLSWKSASPRELKRS